MKTEYTDYEKEIIEEQNSMPECPHCHNKIDPEFCWCGGFMKNHSYYDNHSAIPMGCRCGFSKE